jgi:hypothetical protein
MDYMRSLFKGFCPDPDEVEIRCMLVMALFVGKHFVAAGHPGRSRGDVVELAMKRPLE